MPTVPKMSGRVAGVQFDRQLVFRFGSLPVPAIKVQGESERGVGLAETVVQCQGVGRSRLRLAESILRRKYAIFPIALQCVGVSQARICFGIGWIHFDCMVEISDGCPQAISGSLVPKISSFEVGLISRRVHRLGLLQRYLFLSIQGSPDLLGDGAGYPTLQPQRVAEISFVAFGPNLLVSGHLDQLS